MTCAGSPITISRRRLALVLIACSGLGVAVGEAAAPPAPSQAHAVAAAAPQACRAFADHVASALKDLSVVVGVEGSYALFIPKAYKDGQTNNASDYASIGAKLESLVKRVLAENTAFQNLKGALISSEKQCLA